MSNTVLRFIAISVLAAIAVAITATAATGTFQTYTTFASASSGALLYDNGYVVSLVAAGWVYGDSLARTNGGSSVTWTTLTSHTSQTAIGLAATSGTNCANPPTSTNVFTTASLLGKGAATCPADFATYYTDTTSGSTVNTAFTYSATVKLQNNVALKWTVNFAATAAAANCDGVTVQPAGGTAVTVAATTCSSASALSQAVSTQTYAFYVETAGAAVVCFQTDAQHTIGGCGNPVSTAKSGNILSVAVSGFVALLALIFFN